MAIKRGFKDEFEHDKHVIKKWNSVVHKKDTTYILGDVTMEAHKHYHLLDELNGRKIVILGNHDMRNHVSKLLNHVDQVAGMIKYSRRGYPKMFLTHCPIHPMELDHRVGLNIHGHIHEHVVTREEDNWGVAVTVDDPRYVCVSCEQVDYTPKTIEELLGPSKFNI